MNQIKQGYKQTKVGIIPEDWEDIKIKDIVKVSQGLQIAIDSRFTTPAHNRVFYITIPFIEGKKEEYIENPKSSTLCKKDDILVVRTGSGVGKIIRGVEGAFHNNFFKVKPSNNINIDFFYYFLISPRIQFLMAKYAGNSAIPDLNHGDFYSLDFLIPPLKEQEKIAEILTTWDEAITKQTELLRAKELQKKALMQKLLSGEVRFGGFSDEWEDIRLGKYIKEISKKNKENIDLVLSVTNKHGFIAQKDYFDKEVASKNTSNYKIVKRGNFAYNPSRINVGSLGLLEEYEIGILSPMYVIFECLKGLNKEYLNYWLNTHNFTGNLYKFLSGSVRDSLAFNDMKLMKIKLPVLKEQEKIVEVLSLVDKEIDLLKKELEELKLQKKALMQKLLTGQVRVKV